MRSGQVTLISLLAKAAQLITKIPPDAREIAVDVIEGIADGTPHEQVMDRARRAAIAAAAKRSYRRTP